MEKEPLVLGLDLEGINRDIQVHGLDLAKDRVMEIGAVLWSFRRNAPIQIFSHLIDEEDRLPVSEELRELTGIDEQMLQLWGLKKKDIAEKLRELVTIMDRADYLMAHGAHHYDKPMLGALYERFALEMPRKIWIDSSDDIEFSKTIKHRSLSALEYAHGFINPFPHRALTDTLSMLKVASEYSLDRMARLAESPKVNIVAKLRAPNWKNKSEVEDFNKVKWRVSQAKFRWNPEKRIWSKKVHKLLMDEGKVNYNFDWTVIEGDSR